MTNENIKKISVSTKRQMTIPKQFFDELNIGDEVVCELVDGALMIRPVQEPLDFSEYILADLIKEGYEGDALIEAFKSRKNETNDAIHLMIEQTREYRTYDTVDELFVSLDEDEQDG